MDSSGGGRGRAAGDRGLQPSAADCSICFMPWTADGTHRICCLPCGHVVGRSCLETWFVLCRQNNATCPQCKKKATREEIINLYLPRVPEPETTAEERERRARYSELEQRVSGVEVRTSRLECLEVGSQLEGLRRQVTGVRSEMATVARASDVEQLESEIAGVWDRVSEPDLQDDVHRLWHATEGMRKEMDDLRKLVSEMKSALDQKAPARKRRR